MKIELKHIQFNERMSEETNCFVADLYIDGKKVGYCRNDGQGGETDYRGYTKEDNILITKAEAYCKTLPKAKYGEMEWEQSLDDVIDNLLTQYLIAKEAKKKEKMYQKALCFGVPDAATYRTISWKGKTLKEIDKAYLQKAYDRVKSTLNPNEVFFNTNLKELGLIL